MAITTFKWISSDSPPGRGVVIVAHGLNNRPEIMDSLINSLSQNGLDSCRMALAVDHEKNGDEQTPLGKLWHKGLSDVIAECKRRRPNAPIVGLGYSLGGLVMVSYLDRNPGAFQKMFLLAPAIRLTCKTRLLGPIAKLAGGTNLSLPSLAPKAFRLRGATPFADYDAMFKLSKSVRVLSNPREVGETPTQVLLDRSDELVSFESLAKWKELNQLRRWELDALVVKEGATYRHLVVIPESFDEEKWQQLTCRMIDFFQG